METDTPPRTMNQAGPATVRDEGEHSAVQIYFREIGQFGRITREDEIRLAKRIQVGDAEARQQMILANLRFVVKIAMDYEGLGLPLLDLINEGNIGLMKAVERFDPAKGGKLSTYSSWWIKQSIKRAFANQSKTIRLPVHLMEQISRMRRERLNLLDRLGREPTDRELGQTLGVSAAKVALMRRAAMRPASLDSPVGDESSAHLGELVSDENAAVPDRELSDKNISGILCALIGELPKREVHIIVHRFGLDGEEEQTLEEIGQHFGITRERIRQLQNAALAKLHEKLDQLEADPR
ncbi:MAG: RNA polymerase sigma factor RpoD/SigA [Verrucomicrobiota bacterium]|nr:RNA polymerase sigma factor RpoD/SigA [Verrucomicrobiota bacterium]